MESGSKTATRCFIDGRNASFNQIGQNQYNITYTTQTSEIQEVLSSLKPVDRVGYYVAPCMEGTRERTLKEIYDWLDDDNAPNVLWISGNPGSGKSTLASSLVSRLIELRRLGSSFFFKRGDINLSDPAVVWRTIAYDLGQHNSTFADSLMEAMKGRLILHEMPDIAMHFRILIEEPLMQSYHDCPSPVILIDALDECDPRTVRRQQLVDTLAKWSHLPKRFKIIITSRNERFISDNFRAICKQMVLPTGDSVNDEANGDIYRFFQERLASSGSLSPEWPWKRVLSVLTSRAAGLFIWADTVVKFVEQGLPGMRLALVLKGDLGSGDGTTNLYQQVLYLSFPQPDVSTLQVVRKVVAAIIFAKGPIFYEDLSELVSEPHSSVMYILDKLSSVVTVGKQDRYIHIGHLSFTEFMCDPQRCPEEFFIDRCGESQKLAMACFRLMKNGLRFNICDLQSSHLWNHEVKDLSQKIEKGISAALWYSCRFWVAHLRDTMIRSVCESGLIKEVEEFLYFRILYWLEVLSLKQEVAVASRALLTLASWIQVGIFILFSMFHSRSVAIGIESRIG